MDFQNLTANMLETFENFDVDKCNATVPRDLAMVKGLIRKRWGTTARFNTFVREECRKIIADGFITHLNQFAWWCYLYILLTFIACILAALVP